MKKNLSKQRIFDIEENGTYETKTVTFRVIKYVDVYYVVQGNEFVRADAVGALFVEE